MGFVSVLILSFLYLTEAQQVGEVSDSSSSRYDSSSSESGQLFDVNFDSKYPTFRYDENSYSVDSKEDPLLYPPNPPYYTGSWEVSREDDSINNPGSFDTSRSEWSAPISSYNSFVPYPALNSRSFSSEGLLPSTVSINPDQVQRSQQT